MLDFNILRDPKNARGSTMDIIKQKIKENVSRLFLNFI